MDETKRRKPTRSRSEFFQGVAINIRLSRDLAARLDDWAGNETTRSGAIRLMVEFTLAAGVPVEKLQHLPGGAAPKGKPGPPALARALIVRMLKEQKQGVTVPDILAAAATPEERKVSIHAVRGELCIGKKAQRYANENGKWSLLSGKS
jgi:hypothetical protein